MTSEDHEQDNRASSGRVASELMHDVNGALAVIAASAEYLAGLDVVERRGAKYDDAIADIVASVRRVAGVSHHLLAHARGEDVATLVPPPPEEGPDAPRRSLTRCRILLVEDDAPVRRGLARLLSAEGAIVETAGTGRQAVDRLSSSPPVDLVVLDSDLPDGDGPWVLRRLAQRGWYGAPVLGISGHKSGHALREAGAQAFLAKPFTRAELVLACGQLLRASMTERS